MVLQQESSANEHDSSLQHARRGHLLRGRHATALNIVYFLATAGQPSDTPKQALKTMHPWTCSDLSPHAGTSAGIAGIAKMGCFAACKVVQAMLLIRAAFLYLMGLVNKDSQVRNTWLAYLCLCKPGAHVYIDDHTCRSGTMY